MKPVLEVRELSVRANSSGVRHRLVDNVSFSISAGQATGLVGESGCGKTITALAIMGLLKEPAFTVTAAAIELNGRDISRLGGRQQRALLGRDIAMVFQQPGTALDPVFTLGQQITRVILRHRNETRKQARQTMLQALGKVGFADAEAFAAAYPHELSGGMRQLAMIAMATVCRPAVVLADEPTTALDPGATALILQQLKRLQADHGTAVLLISHDLAVIRKNCRDAMIMYCGRILEANGAGALFARPRHPYTAGLLACIPRIGPRRPAVVDAIGGQVPAMTDLPSGCHFAPRCERADPTCSRAAPPPEALGGGTVACYRPL